MNPRVGKICLVAWAILFAMSCCLMSLPGDFWPWYAVMAVVAAVPMVRVGRRWQRILGAVAFAFSIFLIVMDIRDGSAWEKKRAERKAQWLSSQTNSGAGNPH